ncbi:hypothetical protein C0J52_26733 [Blattella germanica]|nr:hypothetical protein C0J52_26733 [Blattella germanica]
MMSSDRVRYRRWIPVACLVLLVILNFQNVASKRHRGSRNYHHHHHHHHHQNHKMHLDRTSDVDMDESGDIVSKFAEMEDLAVEDNNRNIGDYENSGVPTYVGGDLSVEDDSLDHKINKDFVSNDENDDLGTLGATGDVFYGSRLSIPYYPASQRYNSFNPISKYAYEDNILYDKKFIKESRRNLEETYRSTIEKQKKKHFFPEITDEAVISSGQTGKNAATWKQEHISHDFGDITSESATHKTYHDKEHISKSTDQHKHNQNHKHKKPQSGNIPNEENHHSNHYNYSGYRHTNVLHHRHNHHFDFTDIDLTNRSFRSLLEAEPINEPGGLHWPVKKEAVVEGDLVLGGLMMVHEREDTHTCGPIMPQGGIQALETMLYTLDVVNSAADKIPNVTIGAHILDDCDKDTYGLEMAVDFIKGRGRCHKLYHCISLR